MYIADLHIHSKYSRATSRECIPEYLELWARRKGIHLVGTGDFTHPAWREELNEKLIPAEEGLYTLREDFRLHDACTDGLLRPRFVVTGEISSIYKKGGKVRKVHNVILLPSLEAAELLSQKLEAIGNIHSDGRPILGLDCRDLLEITLEACPDAVFIPAHIWTPHFSLFGAFSGFNTIEECFEDLTPHIHALETGLSSDPPMNWRLSALDGYHLVSNSDAHSPSKLGREANLLEGPLSYPALSHALQTGEGLAGTIEFFPEEGKYHFDGHRNCNLCLSPAEAERYGGICPVCGRKLTIGVQHRVEQLADRDDGARAPNANPFESLAPLPEVIAGSTGLSATGSKVTTQYESMLRQLGPEFSILREIAPEDIERIAGPCVAEGIRRLRAGKVQRSPGYDGAYGRIQLLRPDEIDALNGQICFFIRPASEAQKASVKQQEHSPATCKSVPVETVQEKVSEPLDSLNEEQLVAVTAPERAISVVAGPGTGKTKTLVSRISYLIQERGVKPAEITAVTFTNKAAGEMRERLEKQLGGKRAVRAMTIGTFHAISLQLLTEQNPTIALLDAYDAREIAEEIMKTHDCKLSPTAFLQEVSRKKNGIAAEDSTLSSEAFDAYQEYLCTTQVLDFDDLLIQALEMAETEVDKHAKWQKRFHYLLVDEFQDINALQFRLIQAWNRNGKNLFVIGDPDQSIYGFRGSDAHCFERLRADFPNLREVVLLKNYRSTPEILNCALSVIAENPGKMRCLEAQRPKGPRVSCVTAESDLSEGIYIAKEINRMVGGIDMLDSDAGFSRSEDAPPRSFSDIAVLYRTHRQADIIEKCLRREGIPCIISGRDDFLVDDAVRGAVGFFHFLMDSHNVPALRACLKLVWNCPADLIDHLTQLWTRSHGQASLQETLQMAASEYADVAVLQPFFLQAQEFLPRVGKDKPRKMLDTWAKQHDLTSSEPFQRFLNTAVFHKDMASFLQNLLLGQESDLMRSATGKLYEAGAVTLMTLHGSKGLEYPVVFLSGVRRGKIPLESPKHPVDFEEERRLFYVGMTRAQDELILLTSKEPSCFLESIPKEQLHTVSAGGRKRPSEVKQLSLFD